MFRRTSAKLTLLYLGIIMAISLFFSVSLYSSSIQELNRGFHELGQAIDVFEPNDTSVVDRSIGGHDAVTQNEEQTLASAHKRILTRLIVTNIFILVGAGLVSYYLARRTLRPIEEAHNAQSRFAADASHELRTPLATMQSEIEVALMKPDLSLAQSKKLHVSNLEELDHLTALSDGLLRLARMEPQTINRESGTIDAMITAAISRILPLAEKKNILITPKIDPDISIYVDKHSMVEALVIMLDNAVKYSPAKTEVYIRAAKRRSEIVIRIIDQGIGIKPSDQLHIFERFYRADNSRSKVAAPGYGLGLAIAKSIIDLNGGAIDVKSIPGTGSTFSLRLPLKS